ncbi:hypothetical protein EOT10_26865 [Streptomyces antnestii]|uniref:Helix-turn-helix domain-containing protein n=1 Tax=Streptomyces antnestii TaxID=2494256 RepID=A0A437PF86_9ACTN|nr:hypothetical protein EOT10_26865 [Streptomyces sp. San01]
MELSKEELFLRIRRDSWQEGLSMRALARKFGVHRRLVREALASPVPSSTAWRRLRRRMAIPRPTSIRSTTSCSSNRISSTRECCDSTLIRISPGPGNAFRTEIRIPAI